MAKNPLYVEQVNWRNDLSTDPVANGEIRYVSGTGFRAYSNGSVITLGAGGGGSTFVALSDTPANYTAAGNKVLKVNAGATAVEFVTLSGDASINATGVVSVGDLTIAGEAQGDLLYFDGTGWESLAAGTNGYILKTQGAGADPIWIDPATLPTGIATGLSQSFSIEGGTNDITVSTTTQTVGAAALTIPDFASVADEFTFNDSTQTLTNKTLTAPDINGGTADSLTGFSIRSSGAAFDLEQDTAEVLTGNKIISWTVNDTDRAIDLGGDVTLAAAFTTSGAHALTLTQSAPTNVTLPTTGTLATLDGSETFTNKTLASFLQGPGNTLTMPAATDTLVGKATTDTLTNKTIDADGTGNVITNINGDELDPVTIPVTETAVYGIPVVFMAHVSNEIAAVKITDSAPFKMVLIRAWSQNTSNDGGTWKLLDNASADMTDVVTAAGSDNDIDMAGQIVDATSTISAGQDVYVDANATLDAYIFAEFLRVD